MTCKNNAQRLAGEVSSNHSEDVGVKKDVTTHLRMASGQMSTNYIVLRFVATLQLCVTYSVPIQGSKYSM